MNNEKVNEALIACHTAIYGSGLKSLSSQRNQLAANDYDRLQHALWMIEEARAWPAERLEKKMRWLGFVQGVLWALGVQSVEEAKRQNMPEGEEFKT